MEHADLIDQVRLLHKERKHQGALTEINTKVFFMKTTPYGGQTFRQQGAH